MSTYNPEHDENCTDVYDIRGAKLHAGDVVRRVRDGKRGTVVKFAPGAAPSPAGPGSMPSAGVRFFDADAEDPAFWWGGSRTAWEKLEDAPVMVGEFVGVTADGRGMGHGVDADTQAKLDEREAAFWSAQAEENDETPATRADELHADEAPGELDELHAEAAHAEWRHDRIRRHYGDERPAAHGLPVQDGHVMVCELDGHAVPLPDTDAGVCPRCGVVTAPADTSAPAEYPCRVCVDCAQLAANDEGDDTARARFGQELEDGDRLVILEGEPSFYNFPRCGSCGSTMAGDYWHAVIVGA